MTPWHWSKIAVVSRPAVRPGTVISPTPAFAKACRTPAGRLNCVVWRPKTIVLTSAVYAACSAPTVESDAHISSASSQKSSCPSVMKMMYLAPGVVSAMSALVAARIEYIAGDSYFLPVFMRRSGSATWCRASRTWS